MVLVAFFGSLIRNMSSAKNWAWRRAFRSKHSLFDRAKDRRRRDCSGARVMNPLDAPM